MTGFGSGKRDPRSGGLTGITIETGVNKEGEPFCIVTAQSAGSTALRGELAPEDVRTMALDWLGAAEAADQDALVFRLLTSKAGLDESSAAQFLREMRAAR